MKKLARYLGKHYGKHYKYPEEITSFITRVLTELQNRVAALQKQIIENDQLRNEGSLDDIARIELGFSVIKKLLCGQEATIKIGKKTLVITPDGNLLEFTHFNS